MSAIAAPPRSTDSRHGAPRPAAPSPARRPGGALPPGDGPHHRGGRVLFEVPFASAMTDGDLAHLARILDISTYMHPKMRPHPNSPGVARLDHFSGLFLERGVGEGCWVFQGRTWSSPAPDTIHGWHLLAAQAARQLDPAVTLPAPRSVPAATLPERPLARAENRRLSRLRRRLVGLR